MRLGNDMIIEIMIIMRLYTKETAVNSSKFHIRSHAIFLSLYERIKFTGCLNNADFVGLCVVGQTTTIG